jgi:urate oxidase
MPESISLSECSYGKTGIRLIKVERSGHGDHMRELNVKIQLGGSFAAAYCDGDNSLVLPTDTMKNMVYVLAGGGPIGEIECFAMRLGNHFLQRHSHIRDARVSITEKLWQEIGRNEKPGDCFQLSGPHFRTAAADVSRSGSSFRSGIKELKILKTTKSAFSGFLKDEYTTLQDTEDRLLSSKVNAEWLYQSLMSERRPCWKDVCDVLLGIFATHHSRSVQHTLYAMGREVLERFAAIQEIRLSMSNQHCIPVDLKPFKMENRNEVFLPTEEPAGMIEAVLKRAG